MDVPSSEHCFSSVTFPYILKNTLPLKSWSQYNFFTIQKGCPKLIKRDCLDIYNIGRLFQMTQEF